MSETSLPLCVSSCGLLTVAILVWNVLSTRFLPPPLASNDFCRDIPPLVAYGENSLRLAVAFLPFLMPLEVVTVAQREGSLLFVVGTVLYFLAWVALIISPQSRWCRSQLGDIAPGHTPRIWLAGLDLIGHRLH